jgi:uncharacterized protein YgbK (DUF1537 family)
MPASSLCCSYRGALGAGVTVSRVHSADPAQDGMELMLKGGQMGQEDVFERLLGEVSKQRRDRPRSQE